MFHRTGPLGVDSRRFRLALILAALLLPSGRSAAAQASGPVPGATALIEPDAREVPWDAVRRLALEGGVALPPYQPLSKGELAEALAAARASGAAALRESGERDLLERLLASFAAGPRVSAGARIRLLYGEVGYLQPGQAGLAIPPGIAAVLEPAVAAAAGPWWGAVTARLHGRALRGGRVPANPFLYRGWPTATGTEELRAARLAGGAWSIDLPVAAVGARLGGWAVTAGWSPARTGPGAGGGLLLDDTGPPLPAVTLRRVEPLRWRGPLRALAPAAVLLRVGRASAQRVDARDGWSPRSWRAQPWLTQWLLEWRPARWLSAGGSLAALSVARSGSLLPDMLQVNFPLLSATHVEEERGPVTDRIAALEFEGRWREAPWPLLPAAAGRLYWEYGGEDFNPPGRIPFLPQLSAPASVLGIELLDPRWDLAFEYAELEHPLVLWYANSGLTGGWSQRGWLLGHPLGGSGAGWDATVRWRPPGAALEAGLRTGRATSGRSGVTPGRAIRWSWELSLQPVDGARRWRAAVAREQERVAPYAAAAQSLGWWRAELSRSF